MSPTWFSTHDGQLHVHSRGISCEPGLLTFPRCRYRCVFHNFDWLALEVSNAITHGDAAPHFRRKRRRTTVHDSIGDGGGCCFRVRRTSRRLRHWLRLHGQDQTGGRQRGVKIIGLSVDPLTATPAGRTTSRRRLWLAIRSVHVVVTACKGQSGSETYAYQDNDRLRRALSFGAGAASAASVTKSIDVDAPPAKVWAMIGPFCFDQRVAPCYRQVHHGRQCRADPHAASPSTARPPS